MWITAIKREKWSEKQISSARLCGQHFISGRPSQDPESPDYVPSVFEYNSDRLSSAKLRQRQNRYERVLKRRSALVSVNESDSLDPVVVEEEDIASDTANCKGIQVVEYEVEKLCKTLAKQNGLVKKLHKEIKTLRKRLLKSEKQKSNLKKQVFFFEKIKNDAEHLKFHTGLKSPELFLWVYFLLKNKKRISKMITLNDHLLIVLLKLKLGLYNKDIAHRFGTSAACVSQIFRYWLPLLSDALKFLIIWPEKEALIRNLVSCFNKFRNCVSIIDCTEIFIERPLNLQARAQTWSNYENHNTIKYLISITPAGAVSFMSKGWGGRVSDKELTINSGYLSKLQHGDVVLVDRGFTIEEELACCGATLHIPSFTRRKTQMPAKDVDNSRKISNIRIHVERVIGRLRKFDILNKTIPISQVDLLDDIVICVSGLVNINPSVVHK